MATTTARDQERALAWIASQLRWERTLFGLRGAAEPPAEQRQAA